MIIITIIIRTIMIITIIVMMILNHVTCEMKIFTFYSVGY